MPHRPGVGPATLTPRWAWATAASSLRARGLPFSPVGGYSGRGRRGGKGKPSGEGALALTHGPRARWQGHFFSEQPAERWPVGIPYKGRETRFSETRTR